MDPQPSNEPPDNMRIEEGRPPSRRRTRCSFCGRHSDVTGQMVEGPGDVYMCGDCVEIAYGIILQQRARRRIGPDPNHPAHGR
jgi:ATP-dependent Clp protease ATP-binding subunit ClpX